jgi:hypothetical protein
MIASNIAGAELGLDFAPNAHSLPPLSRSVSGVTGNAEVAQKGDCVPGVLTKSFFPSNQQHCPCAAFRLVTLTDPECGTRLYGSGYREITPLATVGLVLRDQLEISRAAHRC